jgi:outer membrane protein OmpA-like peptidoglycan-associated protein
MKFSVPVVLCMSLAAATAYADDTTTTKSQPRVEQTQKDQQFQKDEQTRQTQKDQRTQQAQMDKSEDVDTFFAFDSADLPAGTSQDLQKLVDWAKCNPKHAIILEGHADKTGPTAYNLELSGRRAAAVRQRLIDMGVPSQRIVITLYGELGKPQATAAKDRRVSGRTVDTPVEPSALNG